MNAHTYDMGGEATSRYGLHWISTYYSDKKMIFSVQSCDSALLLLAAAPFVSDSDAYEIELGYYNNERTVIRMFEKGTILAEEVTHQILSCQEYRTFWLDWRQGQVSLGKGPVHGTNVIFNIANSIQFGLNYIAVGSYNTRTADWQFFPRSGNYFSSTCTLSLYLINTI